MKYLPVSLNIKNESNFHLIFEKRMLGYLRREIFEFLLRREKTISSHEEFFDLKDFSNRRNCDKVMDKILISISQELENLGWKTSSLFQNTGLFIYTETTEPEMVKNWKNI